jgi:hypothetical protein
MTAGTSTLATKHVSKLSHLINDLIHTDANKVGKHNFGYWAHPHQRGACGSTDNGGLRNRCVDTAIWPAIVDASGHAKDAADRAHVARTAIAARDVFTNNEDRLVLLHRLMQGLVDCVTHRFFRHGTSPPYAVAPY